MTKLPYTTNEWDAVRVAAGAVTAAADAGDADGRAARFADLQNLLAELQTKHGDHPLLWETEADFIARLMPAAQQAVADHEHLAKGYAQTEEVATTDPATMRDTKFAAALDIVLDGLALRLKTPGS